MIAIGIGCRKGATRDSIAAIVTRARSLAALADQTAILFSHDRKQGEAGLAAAAAALGLPLRFLTQDALQAVEPLVATRSDHSKDATGIASISEAAALAGAGQGARLIVPRIVGDGVTCAIARGGGR